MRYYYGYKYLRAVNDKGTWQQYPKLKWIIMPNERTIYIFLMKTFLANNHEIKFEFILSSRQIKNKSQVKEGNLDK